MKINFTKKQFRLLLDIVYAGDMVINDCRLPDEEAIFMIWGREEEYSDEFYKNGLDNVKVDIKP